MEATVLPLLHGSVSMAPQQNQQREKMGPTVYPSMSCSSFFLFFLMRNKQKKDHIHLVAASMGSSFHITPRLMVATLLKECTDSALASFTKK